MQAPYLVKTISILFISFIIIGSESSAKKLKECGVFGNYSLIPLKKEDKNLKIKPFAQKSLGFRFGIMSEKTLDLGMSPVSYAGIGGNFGFLIERRTNNLVQIKLSGSFGKLKHREHKAFAPGTALTYHFDGSFLKLYKMKKEKWSFYAGYQTRVFANFREHERYSNSAFNYDLMIGGGISGAALSPDYRFLYRTFRFRYIGGMNLIGAGLRPAFAFSFPEGFETVETPIIKGTANSLKLISFHNHFSYCQQISVELPFRKNTNSVRFFYDFDYYRYNFNNNLRSGYSVFGIDLIMSL